MGGDRVSVHGVAEAISADLAKVVRAILSVEESCKVVIKNYWDVDLNSPVKNSAVWRDCSMKYRT
jgi:hypothetical protein